MTHTYEITGMTCGSCIAKVRSELLKIEAVSSADVGLHAPQATLAMTHHVPLVTLQAAVGKAGPYTIREAGGVQLAVDEADQAPASYYPILLIAGYIAGAAVLVQLRQLPFDAWLWMQHFMAGFFLVFSFFKLLRLRDFTNGYRTYDVVAHALPAWAWIYPFVELALGIAFLTGIAPMPTAAATLVVMGISTVGVARSLWKKQAIQCACLGTVIRLPLSQVTLAEDLLMVAMSTLMLFRDIAA